jgi:hypothetical protein
MNEDVKEEEIFKKVLKEKCSLFSSKQFDEKDIMNNGGILLERLQFRSLIMKFKMEMT